VNDSEEWEGIMAIILHVDDEPNRTASCRDYIKKVRQDEVHYASTIQEAMEKLNETSFDLIIMDIMFTYDPTASSLDCFLDEAGVEMIRRIRDGEFKENPGSTPIIVLTALIDPEIEEKVRSLGVNEFLSKPVKFDRLEQIIQRLTDPGTGVNS
jgi:CheY-like chemotaxis protein